MFHVPNKFRVKGSEEQDGNNGAFWLPKKKLFIIASDGMNWEHVSVSSPNKVRVPTWAEMCLVKNLFWDPEDTVMQLHPPESLYVNNHPGVLHLWRPRFMDIPRPPTELV